MLVITARIGQWLLWMAGTVGGVLASCLVWWFWGMSFCGEGSSGRGRSLPRRRHCSRSSAVSSGWYPAAASLPFLSDRPDRHWLRDVLPRAGALLARLNLAATAELKVVGVDLA